MSHPNSCVGSDKYSRIEFVHRANAFIPRDRVLDLRAGDCASKAAECGCAERGCMTLAMGAGRPRRYGIRPTKLIAY
jgi:hypothetical protein